MDAGLHLLILCADALVHKAACELRDLANLDHACKSLSSLMTNLTPSNASPKAITLLLLCQGYMFPYYRRGEQSPKEKESWSPVRALAYLSSPLFLTRLQMIFVIKGPEPLEELRRTAWWPQFFLMICKQERTPDMKDSLNSTRIAINQL